MRATADVGVLAALVILLCKIKPSTAIGGKEIILPVHACCVCRNTRVAVRRARRVHGDRRKLNAPVGTARYRLPCKRKKAEHVARCCNAMTQLCITQVTQTDI